ncbi:MAG: DUF423 domain-containing protein [Chitinophagales bacterium]|nr:DUF423 domain-containing protein [Chitinophagales bacterium]MDW8272918.1 DUF423 domain-containing protein [Chitinophagales bacterium]
MNIYFVIACLLGALAVGLGAFGAHGLKPLLDSYQTEIYQKAVFYHLAHVLIVVVLSSTENSNRFLWANILFIAGIILFSGSLYLLATAHLTGIPSKIIGPVTPLGGLCFIAGWLVAGWTAMTKGIR